MSKIGKPLNDYEVLAAFFSGLMDEVVIDADLTGAELEKADLRGAELAYFALYPTQKSHEKRPQPLQDYLDTNCIEIAEYPEDRG